MKRELIRTSTWTIAALTVIVLTAASFAAQRNTKSGRFEPDMLTPAYYGAASNNPLRAEIDQFLAAARRERFFHPLGKRAGEAVRFHTPLMGRFGAGKGPGGDKQHHPAVDFHIGFRETNVLLYAAYDGTVATYRDAPKYRHYVSITRDVTDEQGKTLGKIVTLYGHVDLDLDEKAGLSLNGKTVRKGELISKNLYAGTRGGPHLHFEVRYYRPDDEGTETFYGFRFPGQPASDLTAKGAGPWNYGYWNANVGYGFGDPRNHGVRCY